MKADRFFVAAFFITTATLILIAGCKYEVAEPLWEKPFTTPPTPKITQVDPASVAKPGTNIITIKGENLTVGNDTTVIYFNNVPGEVVSLSPSQISVRRPSIAFESCVIKVAPNKALVEAKYSPYKIDPVVEKYGNFLDNLPLSALVVDKSENLFVIETTLRTIRKVTPSGESTVIGTATRSPFDARIGPDGNLYLVENNRAIDKVDLLTGVVTRWTQLPSGKIAKYGDFGNNGYFYTGGIRTDLVIVPFNLSTIPTNSGYYGNDEILAIRVMNNYLYVASRVSIDPPKIYRHLLAANGTVGNQELIFDFKSSPKYSNRLIKGMAISNDGKLFIATDSPDPLLVFDPATKQIDLFYKSILRPYIKQVNWGAGDFIYLITGDDIEPEEWTVYRVNIGTKGFR